MSGSDDSSDSASVQWLSPTSGDIFGPGENIIGKWKVQDNGQTISSPTFKLCTKGSGSEGSDDDESDDGEQDSSSRKRKRDDSDANCGESVQPTVQQDSGVYSVTVAAPTVANNSTFYLAMEDDSGNMLSSPIFSLSPTPQVQNSASTNGTTSATPNTHTSSSSPSSSASTPNLAASRVPTPVVAFAVPLGVVGAILFAAVLLFILHWRKLKAERKKDAESLKTLNADLLSRHSSLSSEKSFASRTSSSAGHSEKVRMVDAPYRTTYEPVMVSAPSRNRSIHPTESYRTQPPHRQATRRPYTEQHYVPQSHLYPATPSMYPHSTISASRFRAAMGYSRPPYSPRPQVMTPLTPMMRPDREEETNARVNHTVISNYAHPSPIPPSLVPSTPMYNPHSTSGRDFAPDVIKEPQRLHVRREAPGHAGDRSMYRTRDAEAQHSAYDRVTQMLMDNR